MSEEQQYLNAQIKAVFITSDPVQGKAVRELLNAQQGMFHAELMDMDKYFDELSQVMEHECAQAMIVIIRTRISELAEKYAPAQESRR